MQVFMQIGVKMYTFGALVTYQSDILVEKRFDYY